MTYSELFAGLHADLIPYYRYWCHDEPMVVSYERERELRRAAGILGRASARYAECYSEFLDLIPYDEKILEFLEFAEEYPYRAGTWRPDYLILKDGGFSFCEITSRFFGNGYFLSYFMERAGEDMAKSAGITDRLSYFEEFLAYMAGMREGRDRLVVLKSADKSDSIKLYVPFYRALGMETDVIEAGEVESSLGLLRGSMVVSALNQRDLLSFSMDTLKYLADLGMRNDFRTIFLLHDKRFFRLFFEDRFTGSFLDEEETVFLRKHAVRTYLYGDPEFDRAREMKDGYILKHHCLGKSEKVYAGSLTDEREWEDLFVSGDVREMILQPFLEQRIFPTNWKGQQLDDYVAGTVLTVDDRYFGTGLFRSSTRPVINQGDMHKVAQLVTDQGDRLPGRHVL